MQPFNVGRIINEEMDHVRSDSASSISLNSLSSTN
jgi:hypothetical protein